MQLVPLGPAHAEALADGPLVFAERFGGSVLDGWVGTPEPLPVLLTQAGGSASPWGPQLLLDDDDALAGTGGWKGPPVDGVAELGYAVAPARQGQGLATEAVRLLLERGRAAGVTLAVAHTLAEPSASTGVLERSGFVRVGTAHDDGVGEVWRWELRLEPVAPTLDGRRFRSSGEQTGDVDGSTTFEYREEPDGLVWAAYHGGAIRLGHLAGRRRGDVLVFRYAHARTDGGTASGRCTSRIEVLAGGRLRLHERWRWESRPGAGTSTLDEVVGE